MRRKSTYLISFGLVLSLIANTAVAELVAHYPLNEGTGTIAVDASGNGHDGTAQNSKPTHPWVDGQPGYGTAILWSGLQQNTSKQLSNL